MRLELSSPALLHLDAAVDASNQDEHGGDKASQPDKNNTLCPALGERVSRVLAGVAIVLQKEVGQEHGEGARDEHLNDDTSQSQIRSRANAATRVGRRADSAPCGLNNERDDIARDEDADVDFGADACQLGPDGELDTFQGDVVGRTDENGADDEHDELSDVGMALEEVEVAVQTADPPAEFAAGAHDGEEHKAPAMEAARPESEDEVHQEEQTVQGGEQRAQPEGGAVVVRRIRYRAERAGPRVDVGAASDVVVHHVGRRKGAGPVGAGAAGVVVGVVMAAAAAAAEAHGLARWSRI